MTPTGLEIVRARADLESELARLFREIVESGDSVVFSPHEFTPEQARRICVYSGRDKYYILMNEGRAIGYGMLRGWDKGYEIPSIGLWVSAAFRGRGLGRRLLNHLQTEAKLAKATTVRLTVEAENKSALSLYQSAGYIFTGVENGRLVGLLAL